MQVFDPATGLWQRMPANQVKEIASLGNIVEPCPYLPDREATLHFLSGDVAGASYRELLDQGYRRNGAYIYRPVCASCDACEVLRVPVAGFEQSREQRRVWKRGSAAFMVRIEPATATRAKSALYTAYLAWQHGTAREEISETQYTEFLVRSCPGVETLEVQLWSGEQLAGVGVVDRFEDALSSVYFYFDPRWARFSPGTYSALLEIELAREWQLAHYYLGYYIGDCRQMNYKSRFKPCEVKRPDDRVWRVIRREKV